MLFKVATVVCVLRDECVFLASLERAHDYIRLFALQNILLFIV